MSSSKLKLIGATGYRTFRNVWMLEELGVAYEHAAKEAPSGKSRRSSMEKTS
jgi:hypothetical protein